ncbi:olfactory receptor 10V1-like [Neophocaena asiaeorientalis asiaeorientalis]|uniref:Olfactory receptor 10V1-like n=1 Tax=Neophocaena asiaeorientalis asiaeorientalis TaxID=1706337 RepID=A0A341BRI0_NEOAA|nr:olfactory receptor 10V1-like [Neophocaena asiaeorientalis asiaeorientalis]
MQRDKCCNWGVHKAIMEHGAGSNSSFLEECGGRGQRLCHQQARCIEYIEDANQTGMIQFHFHPFSKLPEVQMLIFVTFLIMYLVSISGNLSISLIIWIDRSLHAPMYFLLANLAALEICYSSTIAPLTLTSNLSMEKTLVSLPGCGAQMFFFIFLGSADCILLAVMAYDRSVAICHPLRYTLTGLCRYPGPRGHSVCGWCLCPHHPLPACHPVLCLHRGCILKTRSVEGRHTAFSTFSSHLTMVLLQYGGASLSHLCPSSSCSPERGQVVSVVYTFITPMLNPLIYSMKNRELKDALKTALMRFLPP